MVPEGFVEFSMQMMLRAMELRAKGETQERAMRVINDHWQTMDGHTVKSLIDVAAEACLASIDKTIEGQTNGKKPI